VPPADPAPQVPDQAATRRRRAVAAAGLADPFGPAELAAVEAGLSDAEPAVRATALGALARQRRYGLDHLRAGLADPSPVVRSRAAELAPAAGGAAAGGNEAAGGAAAGGNGAAGGAANGELTATEGAHIAAAVDAADVGGVIGSLCEALADPDDSVVDAAAFGLGELGALVAGSPAIAALAAVAGGHREPLCRESAVAALGAIGDAAGLPAVLAATRDKPAVRRRAVLALAAFDGPEVDAALQAGLSDRDWQVRQAAEDLTGRLG
jgi:HEAT repeat protein